MLPRPPWAHEGRPGSAIRSSPGQVNGALRQRTHAVFIPPALKSFQHLRRDLSLEGLCRGNKRALRDLEISRIQPKGMEKGGAHKWRIDIFSHGDQRGLLAYRRDFRPRAPIRLGQTSVVKKVVFSKKTYEGSQCIEIERNFDGHIACADTKNIYATSEIRGSHI